MNQTMDGLDKFIELSLFWQARLGVEVRSTVVSFPSIWGTLLQNACRSTKLSWLFV